MTALAVSPGLSARSSTASLVIDAVMTIPLPTSIFTVAVVCPRRTSSTRQGKTFRALNLIAKLFLKKRQVYAFPSQN